MASLNQCNFIGRLTRDVEIRHTASGTAVGNGCIACSEKYKGEEKTEFVNLVFWGKLAEIVAEFTSKGQEIFVSGRMQTRSWEDSSGVKKYTTEIHCDKMQMLGGKGDKRDSGGGYADPQEPGFDPNDDDSIPF